MKLAAIAALAALIAASGAFADSKDIELVTPAELGASKPALDVVAKALAQKKFNLKLNALPTAADDSLTAAVLGEATPPPAALLDFSDILELGGRHKLGDISSVAVDGHWSGFILQPLQRYLKWRDRWVAAPLDVTPLNGLWLNAALMDKINAVSPNTVDRFFAMLDRARQAGLTPLAVANGPRDLATLFEVIVLAVAGADVYKEAFVDLKELSIKSEEMKSAFDVFARLRTYAPAGDAGVDATSAAQKVVSGEVLAFVGPSSTRMIFSAAGKHADKDYSCLRFPGTSDDILFKADLIAMLAASSDAWPAQSALAEVVMDPQVQIDASRAAGATPIRGAVNPSESLGLDECGEKDVSDVRFAAVSGRFMGSTAYGYTQPAAAAAAYIDVIGKFWRGEIKSSEDATDALYTALNPAR